MSWISMDILIFSFFVAGLYLLIFIFRGVGDTLEDKKIFRNFGIYLAGVGAEISEGVYFGESSFRYSRFGFKDLKVVFFSIDYGERELLILPDEIRFFLTEYDDFFNEIIFRASSSGRYFDENVFLWLKNNYGCVIFPPDCKDVTNDYVIKKVNLIRLAIKRKENFS